MINNEQEQLFLNALRAELSQKVPSHIAEQLIHSVTLARVDENTAVVEIRNDVYGNFMLDKTMCCEVVKACFGANIQVFLKSGTDASPQPREPKPRSSRRGHIDILKDFASASDRETPSTPPEAPVDVLPTTANHTDSFDQETCFLGEQRDMGCDLQPDLNFANFVAGQSNRLALAACEAIAEKPSKHQNPVFIYGPSGLGKTHLLHAVGNEIRKSRPNLRVMYVMGTEFVNQFVGALRLRKQEAFRSKYQKWDVILFDDVQFLQKKMATQEEFFHIFNVLYNSHKQIVLTSDKHPKEIPDIEERLMTRFSQGLIVDIEPPGIEDRIAIIQFKSKQLGLILENDVVEHIAKQVKANVRDIQGVLNRLLAMQHLDGVQPTKEVANNFLRPYVRPQASVLDIRSIQKVVAEHFGIKLSELTSAGRSQKLIIPRHIAMFLTKELMNYTYAETARAFGKSDHTTVMNAVEKVKNRSEIDATTRSDIQEIKRKLESLHE